MTEPPEYPDEPPVGDDALAPLLGNGAVWTDPDPDLEDDIVAAVGSEIRSGEMPRPDRHTGDLRRWLAPVAVGVVAAILVLVGASVLDGGAEQGTTGVAVALAGTEAAPDASAVATVTDTPLGTRIDLDVSGLAPAGRDQYYEGWLWNDDGDAVSAGSFHLRGGVGTIELWAGVGLDEYPRMTVTRETEGEGAAPSGEVVLRSR
ncbi:MAG: anti-sigma factor [Acidimicrobiales bacterium]|nr:anti-sigma factor [Acidimicrobiales bacterium]